MITDAHLRSTLHYTRKAPTGRRIIFTESGHYLLRLRDAVALCKPDGTELVRVATRNYTKAYTGLQRALAGELA